MTDVEQIVRSSLAVASFPASGEEIAALVDLYPAMRQMLAGMDEIPAAQETAPELIFDIRT